MTRKAPYKVIVWGPGIVGQVLLRELVAARDDCELVGVLAYNPEKDGVDVGTFLGVEPVGVAMTTDKEKILELDADVVLFCTQVTAGADMTSETTADVCRLLEGGKNVVTSIGYHHPKFHKNGLSERLEAACRAGGTSLHGTGINPGLLNERFATTLTAACTSIDSIVVQEIGDAVHIDSPDMLRAMGLGQAPPPIPEVVELAARYYGESITLTCEMLGRTVDRIVPEFDYVLAERDYSLKSLTVKAGTMGLVMHKFTAIVEGKPFFRLEEYFLAVPELAPFKMSAADYWTITVEGQPTSIRAEIQMKASFATGERFVKGDSTLPSYYATSIPMFQAIPVVCSAPPGLVPPTVFTTSVPDLRQVG